MGIKSKGFILCLLIGLLGNCVKAAGHLDSSNSNQNIASRDHGRFAVEHNQEDDNRDENIEFLMLFLTFGMLTGVMLYGVKYYTNIPYTPMLLFVGIMVGLFWKSLWYFGESAKFVSEISAHTFLMIFIPALIFESAYNADIFTFIKSKWQILIMAFPGVAINAVLITVILLYILQYQNDLNWAKGLTIGAILGASDPVAVVALLKELGTPVKFNMLLEGESLFNDGSATVFFFVFLDYVARGEFSAGIFFEKFFRLSFGGPAFGIAMGIIFLPIMKFLIVYPKILIVVTFLVAYLTFYLAESNFFEIKVSGILALVALGLLLGDRLRPRIIHTAAEAVEIVWQFASFILETLLFLITGIFLGIFFQSDDVSQLQAADIGKLIAFNILLILARGIMLSINWPLLNLTGDKLNWKDITIMSYAGLRGAIGMSLAIFLATTDEMDNLPSDEVTRFQILTIFYVAGTIAFTVLLNGLTIKYVIIGLDFIKKDLIQDKVDFIIKKTLLLESLKKLEKIKKHKWLNKTNWTKVEEILELKKKAYVVKQLEMKFGDNPPMDEIEKYEMIIQGLKALIDYKREKLEIKYNEENLEGGNNNNAQAQFQAPRPEYPNDVSMSKFNITLNRQPSESVMPEFRQRRSVYDSNINIDQTIKPNQGTENHPYVTSFHPPVEEKNIIHPKSFKKSNLGDTGNLYKMSMHSNLKTSQNRLDTLLLANLRFPHKKSSEILQEIRLRVYGMISALVYEKYENSLCMYITYKNVKNICDLASDHTDEKLTIYSYYKQYYLNLWWDNVCSHLSSLPSILGRYFVFIRFDNIFYSYDILSTFQDILEDLIHDKNNIFFKMFETEKNQIFKEINDDLMIIKTALVDFPQQFISAIHTRKAITIILNHERDVVSKFVARGEIKHKEAENLKSIRGKYRSKIEDVQNLDSHHDKIGQDHTRLRFMFPLLYDFPFEDLKQIKSHSKLIYLKVDDVLFKVGDTVNKMYLILKGSIHFIRRDGKIIRVYLERDIVGLQTAVSKNHKSRIKAVASEDCEIYVVSSMVFCAIANKLPEFKKFCVIEYAYFAIKTKTNNELSTRNPFYSKLSVIKGPNLYDIIKLARHHLFAEVDHELVTENAIYVVRGSLKYKFTHPGGITDWTDIHEDDALTIGKKMLISTASDTYFLEIDIKNFILHQDKQEEIED